MRKKCNVCEKVLRNNQFEKNRRTCKKCRHKKRKKTHNHSCAYCKKTFTSAKKTSKFCSSKCSGDSRRERVETTCSFCKDDIEILPKDQKWERHYCNQECRSLHLKKLVKGENNPNWDRVRKRCDGCKESILVRPFDLKNTKHHFCSHECYRANIGQYYSGPNNSFYNHDLTDEERFDRRKYPEYGEWRLLVFERDDFTCQSCSDNTGGNLVAHHLYNYSEHKELRIDVDNGLTLCKECHINFHVKYGFRNNTPKQMKEFIS